MSETSPATRVYHGVTRAFIAALVLAVFVGLGVLVYVGRLDGEAIVLLSGVIIGYLARMGSESL